MKTYLFYPDLPLKHYSRAIKELFHYYLIFYLFLFFSLITPVALLQSVVQEINKNNTIF